MNLLELLLDLLAESAILRLFVIVAIGYLLGEIRFPGNFRFGLVAVLMVGLGFGAMSPQMTLPAEIQTLGLVLFVYCVGLEVAPGFLGRLRKDGIRLNLAAAAALTLTFALCWALVHWAGQPAALVAGLFCGSLTNTPALAAVTESLAHQGSDGSPAVIGYALAYPFAVVGLLLLMQFRARRERSSGATGQRQAPCVRTYRIQKQPPDVEQWTVYEIHTRTGLVLTRCRLPGQPVAMAEALHTLPLETLVVAVGTEEQHQHAEKLLGEVVAKTVVPELGGLESHRYFVSNPAIVGRRLGELDLPAVGTIVSRIRRGDTDIPVSPATTLLLGDRVRAMSTPEGESAVRKFFGNSLHMLTETGYITFALGISLGLLLGAIPLPIPGLEQPVKLGAAGGPLIVALILGSRGRTGPLIWSLPYTVNLALRHLGLLLFFATVGVKAGGGLSGLSGGNGPMLAAVGAGLMVVSHLVLWLLLGRSRPPLEQVFGASAAMQTQPAALSFAEKKVGSIADLSAAYAAIFPLATILKIVLAQLLLI